MLQSRDKGFKQVLMQEAVPFTAFRLRRFHPEQQLRPTSYTLRLLSPVFLIRLWCSTYSGRRSRVRLQERVSTMSTPGMAMRKRYTLP